MTPNVVGASLPVTRVLRTEPRSATSSAAYSGRSVSDQVFTAVALPVPGTLSPAPLGHTLRSHCVRKTHDPCEGFDASHARALSRAIMLRAAFPGRFVQGAA